MKTSLILSCIVCLPVSVSLAHDRPNIVVVMVDDMGFSDVGPYGGEIPTPHLDALADGGVRFSQFYNTGRCCPTRASLLTGLYSHQTGIGWMTDDQGVAGYRGRLNDQCVTIAEVLGEAGYFTVMTGKWHVGFNHGVTPWGRGFHRSLNTPAGGLHFSNQTGFKGGTKLFLNGEQIARDDPMFDPPWYGSDLWTEQGIRFVDEALAEGKPFFWYLGHIAPHFPCMAPEETIAKYRGKFMAGWDALRERRYERQIASGLIDERWQIEPRPEQVPAWDTLSPDKRKRYDDMMAIYAAMIEGIDANVGKLVAALEERKQLDNTLILFLSDNGGNAEAGVPGKYEGDHPGDPHSNVYIGRCWAHLNNTPFRRYKHYNHEGGIATPLIAHWPAAVEPRPGTDGWIDTPTHVVDLMATCVDLAEAAYPRTFKGKAVTSMQGQSLKPLLTGEGDFPNRPLYWEHEGNAAVRVGDRKLVRQGARGKWELFDLKADRTEQHNLADERPEEVAALKKQWQAWARRSQVLPKPTKKNKKQAAKTPAEDVVPTTPVANESTAPNFVVILTDDQGWGTTSAMYDPQHPLSKSDFFQTPNLERLIAQGMRFTQAYSAHPNCSPSRAALLTGRSPAALHFTDICGRDAGPLYEGNRLIPPQHISDLPKNEKTIPELLKAANPDYVAAHFGKWHLRGGGPQQHGFDASDGATSNREGSTKGNLPEDPKRCFSITKRGVDWMRQQAAAGRPFYLQVSHYATHLGYQSRPATKERFESAAPGERHQNVPYAAMIADMDEAVGQLLDAINSAGVSENTYVVYTADNGTYPTDDAGNINGPLRGSKATIWEAGVRVPFVVAGPGIESGSLCRQPAIGYDVLPTVCELAGRAQWPKTVEGGSLVPALRQSGEIKRPRDYLVFHWPHYQHEKKSKPDSTLIAGNRKLHYWWEEDQVALFDLETDLAEQNDLAAATPQEARMLKRQLFQYLDEVNAQRPETNPEYDPRTDPALVRAGRRNE